MKFLKRRPRISEKRFQSLLTQEDAIVGVDTLAKLWLARFGARTDFPDLSAPERAVQRCLIYTGEVNNGGHTQYFLNRGTAGVDETVQALRDVGIPELAEVLEEAARVLAEDSDALYLMEEFDQRAWCYYDIDHTLQRYLQVHQDEVLVAERRLGRSWFRHLIPKPNTRNG